MSPDVTIYRDQPITVEGGVELMGDLYLPAAHAPVGVVLYRTPYGKDRLWNDFVSPLDCAAGGLAAYVQDIRGFNKSGGLPNFTDWDAESRDTRATCDALAAQPWCSGRFAMAGASFLSMIQLASLTGRHPGLACLSLGMTTVEPFESASTTPVVRFEETYIWILQMMVQSQLRKVGGDPRAMGADYLALAQGLQRPAAMFADLERNGLPEAAWTLEDGILAKAASGELKPYVPARLYADERLPALFATGWYDTFATPMVAMAEEWLGRGDAAAADSRLHVGPWSHSNQMPSNVGQVNFGGVGSGLGLGLPRLHVDFFRRHLLGEDRKVRDSSAFRLFAEQWEPQGPKGAETALDLAADELVLKGQPDLTPTLGGQTHFSAGGAPGPIDQRALTSRTDVALAATAPLEAGLDVTGAVSLTTGAVVVGAPALHAKLCLVRRDGAILPLQEVVASPEAVARDRVVRFPPTRFRVQAGEALAVLVSLQSYPRFLAADAARPGVALNHDSERQFLEIGGALRLELAADALA